MNPPEASASNNSRDDGSKEILSSTESKGGSTTAAAAPSSKPKGNCANRLRRTSSVRYGSVSTREYERIVGDNPGCRSGAPIGIGWCFTEATEISLDAHQNERESIKKNEGSVCRMVPLTDKERRIILKEGWSFSSEEIKQAQDEVSRIQNQREENNAALIRFRLMMQRAKDFGASCQQVFRRANPLYDRSSEFAIGESFDISESTSGANKE